jgi:hypothetical protein
MKSNENAVLARIVCLVATALLLIGARGAMAKPQPHDDMTFKVTPAMLLLALILSGCVHESNRDITSIWITGKACQNCSSGLLIKRNGSIEDVDYQPPLTVLAPRAVGDLLSSFPLDEFHSTVSHMPTLIGPANVVILTVSYRDGRRERAAVPLGQLYNEISKLQR